MERKTDKELRECKKSTLDSSPSSAFLQDFSHNCYAILLAAGQGSRLAKQSQNPLPKQFYSYNSRPLWWHSLNTFSLCPFVKGIVLVVSDEYFEATNKELAIFKKDFSLPIHIVKGGVRRQDSVYNALVSLPKDCDLVLVHDTARPFLKIALISDVINTLINTPFSGVIPSLSLSDTIKEVESYTIDVHKENKDNPSLYKVLSSPLRDKLRAVQTPQAFYKDILLKAHKNLIENKLEVTDDAMALEYIHEDILCIEGDVENKKITYLEDLALIEEKKEIEYITSQGYDVHAYVKEDDKKARAFKLATVPIATKICVKAHSDGDVLLHALMDALLALINAGDIGMHFPDKDNAYDNISSAILLDKVLKLLAESEIKIHLKHIDVTLVAQEPKISPFISQIRKALSHLLSLPIERISIKSTTEEKLGFTGEVKGIKAFVLVTATREF